MKNMNATVESPIILYWPTKASRYHTQRCQYVTQTESDVYEATEQRIDYHDLTECQACYDERTGSEPKPKHTGEQSTLAHRLEQANADDVTGD